MYLFIFESIGTSELLLIGIVALIFLGPRRMPEIARKIGKMMADFRNTTTEFKTTWQREVNFEDEERAIRTGELNEPKPIAHMDSIAPRTSGVDIAEPKVVPIDPAVFEKQARGVIEQHPLKFPENTEDKTIDEDLKAKENWL